MDQDPEEAVESHDRGGDRAPRQTAGRRRHQTGRTRKQETGRKDRNQTDEEEERSVVVTHVSRKEDIA